MRGEPQLVGAQDRRLVEEAGGEAVLLTVPELLPPEVIEKSEQIKNAKKAQSGVAVARVADLENMDGIIMGSPTRFGLTISAVSLP